MKNTEKENKTEFKSKYTKGQRIAAMVCIVLLVLLYVATFVFSLLKFEWAGKLARISIGFTILLPVLIWAYIWMIGKVFHKHTIADFDLLGKPTDHGPVIQVDTANLSSRTKPSENTEDTIGASGD